MVSIVRYDDVFLTQLKGFDIETLEQSPHTIFGLSKDLRLNYVNPSWLKFAAKNGLQEGFLNTFPLNTPIEKIFNYLPLKDAYLKMLKEVLDTGKIWRNEFECSSADVYRYYHQIVYPQKNKEGLIIINSLHIQMPMQGIIGRKAFNANKKLYTQISGFLTQCSNCRRFFAK